VRLVCRILDTALSSYYYVPKPHDDLAVLTWIEEVLVEFPTYGYRRITAELHRRGHPVNHKRVQRILKENDLIRVPRRSVRTTNSQHPYGRYPNRLAQCDVTAPDQVWCADITYIRLPQRFIYLAIVIDVYTRAIRGWSLRATLSSELALVALRRALAQGCPSIHHSDQGIQYAAHGYVGLLQTHGIMPSMSRRGRPADNPYAERVIRTIKEEKVYLNEYETLADAREQIGHFIERVYYYKRIHSALGYLTPAEFELQWQRQAIQAVQTPPLGG